MHRRRFHTHLAGVLVLLAIAGPRVLANTIHVPDDYGLRDAISHSTPGDTVLIAPGYYSVTYVIYLSSGITVRSESGSPSSVTISGGNSSRVFRASSVSDVVLRGLTIRNGYVGGYSNGAGLYCEGSELLLDRVDFRDNGLAQAGGGMWCSSSDVTLVSCTFESNEVGTLHCTNTTWAYMGYGGGACFTNGCTVVASDVTFGSNHTWYAGAGLALIGEGTYADISGGSFTDNTTSTDISSDGALQKGAALFVDGATVTLDGVWFSGNWCNRDGGAVYCGGGASVAVRNCIFVENSAVDQGGAICGPVDVSNCTFVDNAANSGSAVYASQVRSTMYNSILCCTPDAVSTVDVSFARCCRWSSALDGGDGERDYIDADPLFCDYEARDLTLCEDSPCLPDNNDWGELVGALGAGCGPCDIAVHEMSWGRIKAMYRGCE